MSFVNKSMQCIFHRLLANHGREIFGRFLIDLLSSFKLAITSSYCLEYCFVDLVHGRLGADKKIKAKSVLRDLHEESWENIELS